MKHFKFQYKETWKSIEIKEIKQTKTIMLMFLRLVLSLFTVIRFKNEACKSGSGSNGTCYSSGDCSAHGGQASGSCAQGFGVCCLCKSRKMWIRKYDNANKIQNKLLSHNFQLYLCLCESHSYFLEVHLKVNFTISI